MATVTKPARNVAEKQTETKPLDRDQLRRDRIAATVTLIIVALLTALVIWLASLGGGGEIDNFDYYYPMMP